MPNTLTEQVLDAIDIVDVVGERVALRKKGKDFVGLCPFHADHKPSMAVSPAKRIFKCWACGAGGNAIKFVERFEKLEFREALRKLALRAGIELDRSPSQRRASEARSVIHAAVKWAADYFRGNLHGPAGATAREYAARRGISAESIEKFGLGLALDSWNDLLTAAGRVNISAEALRQAGLIATNEAGRTYDRFRNRLIFPIFDSAARPIAFGGRTLADDPAKYLNSPETPLFAKSRILYGMERARMAIQRASAAIVVEGYLDAVLLWQAGVENVVATLGTALSENHLKQIAPLADRLFLCFDGDEAGMRAADRAVEASLRSGADVRVVCLPDGQDPADCVLSAGAGGFAKFLETAVDALEFKWKLASTAFASAGPRGRQLAVEQFLEFVAHVADAGGIDPLKQGMLVSRLCTLLMLPQEAIYAALTRRRRAAGGPAAQDDSALPVESGYGESIRGLPAALCATVEELLGLLMHDSTCWEWIGDDLAGACESSRVWTEAYQMCLQLHADRGEYSLADVVEAAGQDDLCELIDRAAARVRDATDDSQALFEAAQVRLARELSLVRMGDLRRELGAAAESGHSQFDLMRRMSRGTASALPPEAHWTGAQAG